MRKTKSTFKLIRETCGLTHADIAREFNVTERTVRRWEDPKATQNNIPDEVWSSMTELYETFMNDAEYYAYKVIHKCHEEDRTEALVVYYRSQLELDAVQAEFAPGRPLGYANALSRQVCAILWQNDIDVFATYKAD
jgi:predicted transcriptional regulator